MKSWQNKRGSKHSREKESRQRESTGVSCLFGVKCFFFFFHLCMYSIAYNIVMLCLVSHTKDPFYVLLLKVMTYGHIHLRMPTGNLH